MAEAARRAGLDRSHFFRLVRRQGLDARTFR
jgi:transcriptional regulator of acetoin/glycerol metabolism